MGTVHGDSREQRFEQLEQACRKRGMPVTSQRRAVFATLLGRQDHPTADHVYDEVKRQLPGISRTTVFRILDMLVQLGLITKICHPGSAARFDPKIHQHHHLVCTVCETVFDLEAEKLDGIPLPDVSTQGFAIDAYSIHFRGICAGCQARKTIKHEQDCPSQAVREQAAAPRSSSRPPKKGRKT